MSTTGDDSKAMLGATRREDAVEVLLQRASPRPRPPEKDEEMVREAVLAEWQKVTGKRRARRQLLGFAVAASVLMAVAVTFNALRTDGAAPVQVATINKSHGSIYVLGEQSTMHRLPDTSVVMAGQTIMTDHDSGIGLAWGGGGSLRVASDSVVEFIAHDTVYLRSGRIYFDSTPSALIAAISGGSKNVAFRIQTDHGTVTHLGTQYMAYSASDKLEVSVREGEVAIAGKYYDERALAGQQLSISGSARPTVLNIDSYGSAWNWIEETSPTVDTDGRSVDEFLRWVSRETGLLLEYPDAATQQAAAVAILRGNVNMKPSDALAFWLQGQDLRWYTDGGVIKVSAIDSSSGQ
ncbi:MAG: FecR family protein [Gammaproteobacteria bacterium]|nr:FecR family protein [Gammaproteobacteria bacterium]MDH5304033.1 FecR family protein [Gammaproteobacteria bacterium]MDH5321678.1 FecR family protein [Gammaproteobacteria bacterium]